MNATTSVRLYSLEYKDVKTWLFAVAFVVGNIVLPQLFHLVPKGGLTWLPIYFFTLVGAYKYGWRVGLLTAVLSPLINSALCGMPPVAVVPAIEMKGMLLALAASYAASHYQKVSLLLLAGVVLAYQVTGTLGEWALTGSLTTALQDFRIGVPGMLLQVFGGWAVIKYLIRK